MKKAFVREDRVNAYLESHEEYRLVELYEE